MKSWVKWYTETNHDPDVGSLTWEQRGIWAAMCALCGEIDARDDEDHETGQLDTRGRVAWHLRIETAMFDNAIAAFIERGMVQEVGGILYLPNYPKRQERAPSDAREAVAQRVKRHRDKQAARCNEDVTRLKRGVTSTDTDTESDTESESEENREEKKRIDTDTGGVTLDLAYGELVRKAEELTGSLIGGFMRDDVDEMHDAGVTAAELQEAWNIANGKGWKYARAVAINSKNQKRGPAPPPRAAPKQEPGVRPSNVIVGWNGNV